MQVASIGRERKDPQGRAKNKIKKERDPRILFPRYRCNMYSWQCHVEPQDESTFPFLNIIIFPKTTIFGAL